MDISKAARAAGVPVNIIDQPEFCDFQFGSIVNRSPLVIGVSTSNAAPVLAQMVRSRIESIIPDHVAAWTHIARGIRARVSQYFPTLRQRRAFWEGFATRAIERAPNDADKAEPCFPIDDVPERTTTIEVETADDLTLRDIRALQTADVIQILGECPAGILDFARREAKRIEIRSGDLPASKAKTRHNNVIIRGRFPS